VLNIDALKNVYVALGGDAEDFTATTNDEAINLVATVIPSALASVLPEVTAANNGDMLKVVDGEWAKFTPAP
jgi:hypothetical protein